MRISQKEVKRVERLQTTVTLDERQRIAAAAARADRTVSDFIRRAVLTAIDRMNGGQLA